MELHASHFALLCSSYGHHAHNRRHLCNIFSRNHPSFSVHVSAKNEQAHFPNSCFFTHEAGSQTRMGHIRTKYLGVSLTIF